MVPSEFVQWTCVSVCALLSTAFLVRNLAPSLLGTEFSAAGGNLAGGSSDEQKRKGKLLVGAVCIVHLAIGLVTKLYFFY